MFILAGSEFSVETKPDRLSSFFWIFWKVCEFPLFIAWIFFYCCTHFYISSFWYVLNFRKRFLLCSILQLSTILYIYILFSKEVLSLDLGDNILGMNGGGSWIIVLGMRRQRWQANRYRYRWRRKERGRRKKWVRSEGEDGEREDRETGTNRWEIPFRIISGWPGFVWTRTNRFHWLPRPLFRPVITRVFLTPFQRPLKPSTDSPPLEISHYSIEWNYSLHDFTLMDSFFFFF